MHGRRADRVSEHRQFGRDAPDAPGPVLGRDPDDECTDAGVERPAAGGAAAALPTPVVAPRRPVPADHRGGLHQLEMSAPRPPVPRRHRPEAPIRGRHLRSTPRQPTVRAEGPGRTIVMRW